MPVHAPVLLRPPVLALSPSPARAAQCPSARAPFCPYRGCATGWAKISSQMSEQTFLVVPPRNDSLRLWNEAQQETCSGPQWDDGARSRPQGARGAGWALHRWEEWDPSRCAVRAWMQSCEQRECSHPHCSAFNVGLIKIITAPSLLV